MTNHTARKSAKLFGVMISTLLLQLATAYSTYSGTEPWTTPINISLSGAASQPVIVAGPDGTLHALWWDSFNGEQYARTVGGSDTWSKPVTVAGLYGQRTVSTDTQTQKSTVSLVPPREVHALSDNEGGLRVFWTDTQNQLLSTSVISASWGQVSAVTEAATAVDMSYDISGTLNVVYVRPVDSQGLPSGVYYRALANTGWSAPVLIYPSLYFRNANAEVLHLSIAADGQSRVVVAWDDPSQRDGFFALSADSGKTWESPRRVLADSAGIVTRATVAHATNGEFFMLWRNPNAGGCGFTQVRSNDGARSWTAPERILVGIKTCPDRWWLVTDGEKRLWFSGLTGARTSDATGTFIAQGKGVLAMWDVHGWSEPLDVSLSFYDAKSKGTRNIGSVGMTFARQTVAIVTSSAEGDVWVARNAVAVGELVTNLTPTWRGIDVLSTAGGSVTSDAVPALASDKDGSLYAMWSQSDNDRNRGTALYVAVWNGTNWSHAVPVLRSPNRLENSVTNVQPLSRAEQPTIVTDGNGKLHAAWVSGANGELLYSSAYVRDATSLQGWAQPVKLPAPTAVNSRPSMIVDPRTNALYILAAVPYNEKRGVYLFRSNDGGKTWTNPTVVFDAQTAGWNHADKPRIAQDVEAGVLHATWLRASLPGAAEPAAVFYSRSTDGGLNWSPPLTVTEGAVDWPQVVVARGREVYLSWSELGGQNSSGAATTRLAGQFSPDAGEHWTAATRVSGFENLNGPVGLASDFNGHLYVTAMGQATSGESILHFAHWDGQSWSSTESFNLGQTAVAGNAAVLAALPSTGWLGAVLQQGRFGPGAAEQFEITATGRKIANMELVPIPTFTPMPASKPTPGITPTPAPTDVPQVSVSGTLPGSSANSTQAGGALAVSGALAVVIVTGVIVARTFLKRRLH
jgi:hypothetical protein